MNCKPGDLAFLTKARLEGNVGLVCTVLEYAGRINGLDCWHIEASPTIGVKISNGRKVGITISRTSVHPDAWLRPISGVPVHDEQPEEAKEPV